MILLNKLRKQKKYQKKDHKKLRRGENMKKHRGRKKMKIKNLKQQENMKKNLRKSNRINQI